SSLTLSAEIPPRKEFYHNTSGGRRDAHRHYGISAPQTQNGPPIQGEPLVGLALSCDLVHDCTLPTGSRTVCGIAEEFADFRTARRRIRRNYDQARLGC